MRLIVIFFLIITTLALTAGGDQPTVFHQHALFMLTLGVRSERQKYVADSECLLKIRSTLPREHNWQTRMNAWPY